MLLRGGKFKQAAILAQAFIDDKATAQSPLRDRAIYYLGYANFAMKNTLAAGRALSQLAPFDQKFGDHARYLLARTHHLSDERPEAAALYEALIAKHVRAKAAAIEALKRPGRLTAAQRRQAEAAAAANPPDYAVRASFYAALLKLESERFGDALAGLTAFAGQQSDHPLAGEALLRAGYCSLKLRDYDEAIKTLEPLRTHATLASRAIAWQARARVAGADKDDAETYAEVLTAAIAELNKAAQIAHTRSQRDPAARVRRGEIMIELADTQQIAGQYKEATSTYQRVLSEGANPDRAEEVTQRLAAAYHLSGSYAQSDQVCDSFAKAYPASTLLPAVLFRKAENACLAAMAASSARYSARSQDLERAFQKAVDRYRRLLEKFPDFAQGDLARYGMATAQYQLGRYDKALETLLAIPEVNRTGELAPVAYLMADCYIRALPANADDALVAAKLMDQAGRAAKLLDSFASSESKSPLAPDALLKLGHCYQRIGAVLIDPADQKNSYTQAKGTYEMLLKQYAGDKLATAAVFERAKCMVLLGQTQEGMDELDRFRRDPFRTTNVAPMALVRLASLHRARKDPVEAATILQEYRTFLRTVKRRDLSRTEWGAPFDYEQAVALAEAGRLGEAKKMFDSLIRQFPGKPEAHNAVWRYAQCSRREVLVTLTASQKLAAKGGATKEELSAAARAVQQSERDLAGAAVRAKAQAEAFGRTIEGTTPHLRMHYETAWCYRTLSDREIVTARDRIQQTALSRVLSRWPRKKNVRQRPALAAPPVALGDMPVQPSEAAAREQYALLIAAGGEAPLAVLARFELAEMLAARGEDANAVELLETALESTPPADLAQRIRLRLSACLLAGNKPAAALAQIELVAGKAAGTQAGEARYLAGEACAQQKDWTRAVEQLLPFSTTDPFHSMTGIADRALLRLGNVYAKAGNWEESRRAFETLISRFPRSPWVHEARYGMGWAREKAGSHDSAVSDYGVVVQRTAGEAAARARIRIGLCQLALKKPTEAAAALLVVPYTYGYPECSAEALCEAGRAYVELKQPDEAAKLWRRVIASYPKSPWAQKARDRLAALKK